MRKGLGIVWRSSRDEPMWIAIYMHIETMLVISLYSYLYLKLAKMLCLSYYLLCFLFNKIRELEEGTGSSQKQRAEWRKRWRWPNNVYTCEEMEK
jgi:hypothetical protein